MTTNSDRSWRLERATVHHEGAEARSNKYSASDSTLERKPAPHRRSRVWVGGYTRADGTKVKGHYRTAR